MLLGSRIKSFVFVWSASVTYIGMAVYPSFKEYYQLGFIPSRKYFHILGYILFTPGFILDVFFAKK